MGFKEAFNIVVKQLREDEEYNFAWQSNIAVAFQDTLSSAGYQLPELHKGYHSRKINIIYLVTRRRAWGDVEEVDVLCFFTEYRKAIEYVNSFPDKFNVSYDIDEVEEK